MPRSPGAAKWILCRWTKWSDITPCSTGGPSGGEELYEHASKRLGVGHKQTTPDGQFSLEEVECMGACSWAPTVTINYDYYHNVTPEQLDKLLDGLKRVP